MTTTLVLDEYLLGSGYTISCGRERERATDAMSQPSRPIPCRQTPESMRDRGEARPIP